MSQVGEWLGKLVGRIGGTAGLVGFRITRPLFLGLLFGAVAFSTMLLFRQPTRVAGAAFLVILVASTVPLVQALRTLPSLSGVEGDDENHHAIRVRLVVWSVAGIYAFAGEMALLAVLSVPADITLSIIELSVLAGTVWFLAVFARYSALSFAADMQRLVAETRSASDRSTDAFLKSGQVLAKAFSESTDRLLLRLGEHSQEQARILAGMAAALDRLASAMKSQKKLAEETRKLSEEAVRLQRDTEKKREALDREREEAKIAAEDAARRQMMPRLGVQMRVAGVFSHHIYVDVLNSGMNGQALVVTLSAEGGAPLRESGGTMSTQVQKTFDFGDVSNFPLTATLYVACRIADAVGRRYEFRASFEYGRTLGFWGQTKTKWIRPTGMVWPDALPVDGKP